MALCAFGTGRRRLTSQRSGRRTLLVLPAIAGLALVISACQTIPAPPTTTTTTTGGGGGGFTGWGPPANAPAPGLGIPFTNDPAQTGWYNKPADGTLKTNLAGMTQKFNTQVGGQVYASPVIGGAGSKLFVATEDNNVYGLDPSGGGNPNGIIDWGPVNVGTPSNSVDPTAGLSCTDLSPHIGITGTAAVDSGTNTAYVVAKSYASGTSGATVFKMHAFDMTNGSERAGFPVTIQGQASNGGGSFDPERLLQRPALLLMDGTVFAGFGGICDTQPYRGWVAAVPENGTAAGWSTPSTLWTTGTSGAGAEGAVWMTNAPIVSDQTDQLLISTGNGTSPGAGPGTSPPGSLASSVVRLKYTPATHTLAATDFFSPWNNQALSNLDLDLGSTGVLPLSSGDGWGTPAMPNVGLTASKGGQIYVLNRDFLGGQAQASGGGDGVPQRIDTPPPGGGYYDTFTAWPGDGHLVYIVPGGPNSQPDGLTYPLTAYKQVTNAQGLPQLQQVAQSHELFGFTSSSPTVTSNGSTDGSALVWVVQASHAAGDISPGLPGSPAMLQVYEAAPAGGTLTLLKSFPIGRATKFTRPYVNAGMVYVGTRDPNPTPGGTLGRVIGFG